MSNLPLAERNSERRRGPSILRGTALSPATPGRRRVEGRTVIAGLKFDFARQRIVVAGEDSPVVALAISTLRQDGHRVTHAADTPSALDELELGECHLLIVASSIAGPARTALLDQARLLRPALAFLCLTAGWSAPGRRARSRRMASFLHEPFTAEQLRGAIRPLLPQLRLGSILALAAMTSPPLAS